jgi:hypothetical protein
MPIKASQKVVLEMKTLRFSLPVLMALSLVSAGCVASVQVGGEHNSAKVTVGTSGASQAEAASAPQPTPQPSPSISNDELSERLKRAEEHNQNLQQEVDALKSNQNQTADATEGESGSHRAFSTAPKRRTVSSGEGYYYQQPVRTPEEYSRTVGPQPYRGQSSSIPAQSSPPATSSQPTITAPAPAPPMKQERTGERIVYAPIEPIDTRNQEEPRRGHSTRKKAVIVAGMAGVATLGYLLGRKH